MPACQPTTTIATTAVLLSDISCPTCDLIDSDTRCPYNATEPTIFNPGDLDKLFTRLTTEDYNYVQNYQAAIHSMPNPNPRLDNIPNGPWLVMLEPFIRDDECNRLIQLGAAEGYKISKRIYNLYKSCILSTEFNSPPNLVRDMAIYSTRAGSMLTSAGPAWDLRVQPYGTRR